MNRGRAWPAARGMPRKQPLLALLLCLIAAMLLSVEVARADAIVVKSAELLVEDEDYVLNAQFEFAFNPTLEEALQKGISLYFVLEFELGRPRWYWVDEKVAQRSVQYRLSYMPLTRQYRLTSGLFAQEFDSIEEVQRILSRVVSRPVVARDALVKGARYDAAVRLRLDGNLLPKPFQVNALTSSDWSLQSEWYHWSFTP
jgi:Domain of unknown function (DUF4390)